MQLELKDAYKHLYSVRYDIHRLYNIIYYQLPFNIVNEFFIKQEKFYQQDLTRLFNNIDKKISILKRRHIINTANIKPIEFYCKYNLDNNMKIELTRPIGSSTNDGSLDPYTVRLDPNSFSAQYDLSNLQDKWFVNLSSVDVPEEVRFLLQLGDRFNIPYTHYNKDQLIIDHLKCIESNIEKIQGDPQNDIRNRSAIILNEIHNKKFSYNY